MSWMEFIHLWTMSQASTSAGHICRAHHLKNLETVKSMVLSAFLTWTHPIICPTPTHPQALTSQTPLHSKAPLCCVYWSVLHFSPKHLIHHLPAPHQYLSTWRCDLTPVVTYLTLFYNLHISDLWSEIITNYLSPCTLRALCYNSSRWTYFSRSSPPWTHSLSQPFSPTSNKTI